MGAKLSRKGKAAEYQIAPAGEEAGDGAEPAPPQAEFAERWRSFVLHRPTWWQRLCFMLFLYNIIVPPFRFCVDIWAPLSWAVADLGLDLILLFNWLANMLLPPKEPETPLEVATGAASSAAAAAISAIAAVAAPQIAGRARAGTAATVPPPRKLGGAAAQKPPGLQLLGDRTAPTGRRPGRQWLRRNIRKFSSVRELCALLPLDVIGLALSGAPHVHALHPAFRLNKCILRLPSVDAYMHELEEQLDGVVSRQMVTCVDLALKIFGFVHLLGCGWCLAVRSDGEIPQMWYWTQRPGLLLRDPFERYLVGLYWALTMMTGYGSILPQTNGQVIFSFVTVLIGVSMNVTVIGILGSLVQNLDSSKTSHQQKINSITEYMSYRKISPLVRSRVIGYYSYLWQSRRGLDEGKLIQELPQYLQEEVSLFINREIISKVPLFHECDEQFKSAVVVKLIPVTLLPDSFIVRKGEVGREMYFISRGEVQVVSDARNKEDRTVYATLRDGSFFGEVALLLNDSRRTATVVASAFCDLFVLRKEDFDLIRETFPLQSKTIAKAAHKRYKLQQENEADEDDNG